MTKTKNSLQANCFPIIFLLPLTLVPSISSQVLIISDVKSFSPFNSMEREFGRDFQLLCI